MKKLRLKITKGLKTIMLIGSILGYAYVAHSHKVVCAKVNFSFIGMVAALKGKKLEGGKTAYDSLDEGTKTFVDHLDSVMQDVLKDNISAKELDTRFEEFSKKHGAGLNEEQLTEFKETVAAVKKQAQEIQKFKDAGLHNSGMQNPIVKALTDNKEAITKFLASKQGTFTLDVKTATLQDPATDIIDQTIGLRVPGIGQIPVRKPFIEDIFPAVNCNLEFIKYIDQKTVVRDAQNVAGAASMNSDTKVTWQEYNIQISKVKDFIDVPIDMMQDYDFVEGEIRNLISSSVQLKVDNGLLSDDGNYPNLHSINEVASEFSATNTLGGTIEPWAGTVQAPNIYDVAIAMASQIIALGDDNSYIPDTILWNTIDKYKSMLIKDKFDNYLLPPFVVKVAGNEYNIDNMRVRTNPLVPANSMYMFDSSKGTIYNRKGIAIELSYENNNNFENEVVTMKAYRRLNLLIRNVNKNAFMKCSDIGAAIVALQTP